MAVIDRTRWNVLEPLLDEVLDLEPDARAPWLESLSRRAPDVASELGELLTGEVSADQEGFLARPLALTLEGVQVGAYTLERALGSGGMGSVWLARRSDGRFEGLAAVKLLNLSLFGTAGHVRFRREGSMLARLAHHGIARLLDAGVNAGGQPYLVLEYVDGQHLDVYADEHALSREQRISLFLEVLAAVGHAHANLVVHRDLKPSNILVTPGGSVKLLDFGVATLTAAESVDDASTTSEGAAGFTPKFAAPEQVRGDAVTTATDVYSLGVILYLLLSGRHPTAEDCVSRGDVPRATLEVTPVLLAPRDLGSVVAKALRKDPLERYQNVEAFADDLQRYLHHEPVTAAPDSLVYGAGKFIRRHSTGVTIAATTFVMLVGATTLSLSQRREAERQRDAAVAATRRADAQAEFASFIMEQVGDEPITAREILDRAREGVEYQNGGDSAFLSSALLQLSDRYAELGDVPVRARLLARAESIAVLIDDEARLTEVRCSTADNLRLQGKQDEADLVLSSAEAALPRLSDPSIEASCLLVRAQLENERGRPERSAPAIYRALALRDSVGATRDLFYVSLLTELGYTLDRQNLGRDGVRAKQRALAIMDSIGRGQTISDALIRHNMAVTYGGLGETATAEAMLQDVLRRLQGSDPSGRMPVQALIHYAHAALYQGHADSARKYFAMLAAQGVDDRNPYWEGRALFGLAQAELMDGRTRDARATIERFRRISGNPDLVRSDDQVVNVNTLDALVALAAGDTVRGNALVHETLSKYGYFTGKRSSTLHSTLILAARTAIALGHADSALTFARDARKTATRDSLSETRSAHAGEAWLLEALAHLRQGDNQAAKAAADHAMIALNAGAGPDNPRTREADALLAKLR
jgi:serine/threonine-protein kinase